MRSFLFLDGDASKVYDLDGVTNRLGLEKTVATAAYSSSGFVWSAQARDTSTVRVLAVPSAGSTSKHDCGFELEWEGRLATWKLSATPGGSEILLNGSPLRTSRSLTQDACWIEIVSATGGGSARFLFKKIPDAPKYEGHISREVLLTEKGLRIGRRNEKAQMPGTLVLDGEIRSISSNHAEVAWDKKTKKWILKNVHTTPLLVNGTSDYDHENYSLVFGDCLQIPGYKYYTFQFDGRSLVHLGDGGVIQARELEKVVKDGRRILSNINLDLRCGEFIGVLGGSGQGKSTMMNAVCAISPATFGQVWLDGRQLRSASDIADEAIGYVPQDDIVHRELTVREALFYAGKLRLAIDDRQLGSAIDRVLQSLELQAHQEKRIQVLSGGQRKRVSIASELLTNPQFLFLDEPTSGLDPQTEWELMGLLHRLRLSRPMGIFCTTHVLQKSHVFDAVIFVHGGRIIFKGSPVDAAKYFMVDRPFDQDGEQGTDEDGSGDSEMNEARSDVSDERLLNSLPLVYGRIEGTFKKLSRKRGDANLTSDAEVVEEMERVYLESKYRQPLDPLVREIREGGKPGKSRHRKKAKRPGSARTLMILMARQWRILRAEPLNLVFLIAQALVIGFLVGWVSENLVFQMFIAVIATLWFGCSNAAQQIVGELPIFRRERLAGVGLNVYLVGKFSFLTVITSVQAFMLFSALLLSHHLFHPEVLPLYPEPDRAQNKKAFTEIFFSNRPDYMDPGVAAPPIPSFDGHTNGSPDPIAGFEVIFQEGMNSAPSGPVAYFENPTGLRAYDAQFQVLESVAWIFRIRENLVDELGVQKVEISREQPYVPSSKRNWWAFTGLLLALRIGALLLAGVTGVALGLAVSALVQSPTQAVMWVPLILIPQILFGGFVVTSPEMEAPVRRFSEALPSFNLQRLQDVANLYGRKSPRITNKTKIPAFFSAPPYDEETVRWSNRNGDHQQLYDKISEVSKSWQNLVVLPGVIGERFKEGESDSVSFRRDVIFPEGVGFRFSGGATRSVSVLLIWVIVLYFVALIGLRTKQVQ